jgi:hypothetical protein
VRSLLRNVLAAAVSSAIAVGAAELWLRSADPLGTRFWNEYRAYCTLLKRDTVVYYRNTPGGPLRGRGWTLSINGDGMRGPALPPVKDARTFRVLLLGDSVVLGWGVSWEQTVASRLAAPLSALRGGSVEVVADGAGSWNTVAEMRDLYARLDRLDPDAVLLLYIQNDSEVKPETPPEAHGGPWPMPPPDSGWDRLALVRSLRTYQRLRQVGPSAPTDAADAGRLAVVDALRACRDLCRAAGIPFHLVSYGPYEDMRAQLAETSAELSLRHFDYGEDFPGSYLRKVRNSRLDGHFDGRGHARLTERIVSSAGPELVGGETRVGRARPVSVRSLEGVPVTLAWGLGLRRGLELPAGAEGTFVFLARPGALPAGTSVPVTWVPSGQGLPSRLVAGTWTPLLVPALRSPRRLLLDVGASRDAEPSLEVTPVLTLAPAGVPRKPASRAPDPAATP